MPTLEEWEHALTIPRRVRVDSSQELIDAVQRLHDIKDRKLQGKGKPIPDRKTNLVELPMFSPPRHVDIIPAYLLLRLGVVTTPPIPNLADICSTWARIRYLWAFQIPADNRTTPLRLSEEARRIDFHQKALLSDEIGVGMSAVLLGTYFDAPRALDVSLAMQDPNWRIRQQSDSSPDYLFFDSTQTNLYVIECKGTQSTRSNSLKQLRRGTEQIASLKFGNRPDPPSMVIATCLSRSGTQVLIVDPPGDDSSQWEDEKPKRVNKREWEIPDPVRFARTTRLISDAKTLAFAGQEEQSIAKLAQTYVRTPPRIRQVRREIETTENELGVFRGVRQPVAIQDRSRVEVFQGIDEQINEELLRDDPERTEETRGAFHRRTARFNAGQTNQPIAVQHLPGTLIVSTAGPDGTVLEFRINEG